jgi:4'-phosphopantetheinyl transferase
MKIGGYRKEWFEMLGHARQAPESISVWTCCNHHYARYIDQMGQTLSEDEQARAVRFHRRADYDRYVLGRFVLRNIWADWFAVSVAELDFGITAAGRPFLQRAGRLAAPAVDFNLSHSGDATIVAWSPSQRVGVDTEHRISNDARHLTRLAEKTFSPQERLVLAGVKPQHLADTFYKIWVRKEALLKAEGCGLSGALASFSVAVQRDREINWSEDVVYGSASSIWTIVELTVAAGHVAALAKRPGVRHYQYPRQIDCSPPHSTAKTACLF